ncbi:SNF2-related protein [Enterocloster lavalensis]
MDYDLRVKTPIYQAVLENSPERYPGYARLLRGKRRDYENQNKQFTDMKEDPNIARWLSGFVLWDAENNEAIHLNELQRHDLNLVLQKRNSLLQWEQGSGKTLAGIAVGQYRMDCQAVRYTWVVSSAISIRNNWDVVLRNYGISYVFVEKLKDLEKIRSGDFVIITLNKISQYQKQISKWIKRRRQKIQLVLDESDEISNANSQRTKAVLACFRRCRMKLLTTGTSTRNNISEFAPQLELLYNNSIHMLSWCSKLYRHKGKDSHLESHNNPYYRQPIPAYKKGYSLFSASHLPDKITVFGVEQKTQDIYNADVLSEILGKTVITRTFEEVCGKNIKQLHQVPVLFPPEEKEVYEKAMDEFLVMRNDYFNLTGNSRKDSMMKLIQQIVLLLRISAAPDTVKEYGGDTPVKVMAAVELAAGWENEIVAIGVRHKVVLDSYARAIRKYLPNRPLYIVTGSNTTFAKRRALRQTLRESKNGILLCTQQSLASSVNFEFVNKIIIPELHYNNSGMSQFYFRFIRYTSTEYKDVYFITYAGSIESNLMQMILVKEKLNLFMKGQDTNLDEIYERFDVDYDLLSLLMYQEEDDKGRLRIRWGKQNIA